MSSRLQKSLIDFYFFSPLVCLTVKVGHRNGFPLLAVRRSMGLPLIGSASCHECMLYHIWYILRFKNGDQKKASSCQSQNPHFLSADVNGAYWYLIGYDCYFNKMEFATNK